MNFWKTVPVLVLAVMLALTTNRGVGAQPSTAGRLRLELFVNDVPKSIAFYRDALGFDTVREEKGYASMRLGTVEFGIGPLDGLPKGHCFRPEIATQRRGLGTENT